MTDGNTENDQEIIEPLGTPIADPVAVAQKERDEYLAGWKRAQADAVNMRKDAAQASERAVQRTKEGIFEELIAVMDSFSMAMSGTGWNSVDPVWAKGVENIRGQLQSVFDSHRISTYGAVGDVFDHALHEALTETEEGDQPSGTIAQVIRPGYRLNDRVIRPAQVIVKK